MTSCHLMSLRCVGHALKEPLAKKYKLKAWEFALLVPG